jgi:hypothetical protein
MYGKNEAVDDINKKAEKAHAAEAAPAAAAPAGEVDDI